MSKKVQILYKEFQENGLEELQENPEYIEATKRVLERLNKVRSAIPEEHKKILNEYDDSMVELQGIMLKAYYTQGYKDGSRAGD
jgi:hypothetical protein